MKSIHFFQATFLLIGAAMFLAQRRAARLRN
jgi:hypothetical protein